MFENFASGLPSSLKQLLGMLQSLGIFIGVFVALFMVWRRRYIRLQQTLAGLGDEARLSHGEAVKLVIAADAVEAVITWFSMGGMAGTVVGALSAFLQVAAALAGPGQGVGAREGFSLLLQGLGTALLTTLIGIVLTFSTELSSEHSLSRARALAQLATQRADSEMLASIPDGSPCTYMEAEVSS